ncbi:uncharacterized protein [Drosophila kikkawai]|uniref:MD-2-related lipid-recognition domain-containing protein n=1 Tax=Drosophila kikkawai TaxID=30033 RepID=A0A6P4IXE3_DROKI|nr:uncharacterized protein LOC108078600 [Drosophila kikkawai]
MESALRLLGVLSVLLTWRSSDSTSYKLSNVVCGSYNQSWVRINECRLKAISRNKTIFNFNATFLHPTNDIVMHNRMFKRESGYKPWLINTKVNSCQFMIRPYNPFVLFIFKLYKDFSNINHTCPYYGDMIIKGMYLTRNIEALPIPTGDYMLAIDWLFYRKPQFATNVSFQFVENLI